MAGQSAGILMFRKKPEPEVFLVHPGGPFWQKKDLGSWSIPKGEYNSEEDQLAAAKREFFEETGSQVTGDCIPLAPIRQKSGKMVTAWAVEGDIDISTVVSNTFDMPWPPRSGKMQTFPEIDRAEWFPLAEARMKINEKQAALLDELEALLKSPRL